MALVFVLVVYDASFSDFQSANDRLNVLIMPLSLYTSTLLL